MKSNERLKKKFYEIVHHTNNWNKFPAITSDGTYTYLNWGYDNKKICVKSTDYNLIKLIEEAIEIYLEEKS